MMADEVALFILGLWFVRLVLSAIESAELREANAQVAYYEDVIDELMDE